jgi:sugar lactone lactonase YvrE
MHEARGVGLDWRETQRRDLGRPVAAVIPRARGGLVVAGGSDVLLMGVEGDLTPLAGLGDEAQHVRFNDAKCDAAGRLWATTLAVDLERRAGLYRIDPNGELRRALDGMRLANGLAWSPGGGVLYVADSVDRVVFATDFDPISGEVGRPHPLVTFELGEGAPNGLTVDDEGALWIALTGGGEVRRYSADGRLLERLALPVSAPTSCAFGDTDRGSLFITTRSGRMPEFAATLLAIPETRMESSGDGAGAVWLYRPGVGGDPGTPFAG